MREVIGEAEAAAGAAGSGTLFFNARADEITHEILTGLGYSAKGVNVTFIKKGEYIPPGRFCVAPWAG
jgi:hypothetical protein